jgi:hypothetical protein
LAAVCSDASDGFGDEVAEGGDGVGAGGVGESLDVLKVAFAGFEELAGRGDEKAENSGFAVLALGEGALGDEAVNGDSCLDLEEEGSARGSGDRGEGAVWDVRDKLAVENACDGGWRSLECQTVGACPGADGSVDNSLVEVGGGEADVSGEAIADEVMEGLGHLAARALVDLPGVQTDSGKEFGVFEGGFWAVGEVEEWGDETDGAAGVWAIVGRVGREGGFE